MPQFPASHGSTRLSLADFRRYAGLALLVGLLSWVFWAMYPGGVVRLLFRAVWEPPARSEVVRLWRENGVTTLDNSARNLRSHLPPRGDVGLTAAPGLPFGELEYFQAQYCLAPLRLIRGTDLPYVVEHSGSALGLLKSPSPPTGRAHASGHPLRTPAGHLAAVIALLLSGLQGWLLVRAILPPSGSGKFESLFRGCLALGIGLGLSSFAYYLARVLGLPLPGGLWATDAVLASGLFAVVLLRPGLRVPLGRFPTRPGRDDWLAIPVISLALANLPGFLATSLQNPHGYWDAWAIWNLRARFLVRSASHWTDAFAPSLEWSHLDYPLLLPATVARLWTHLGAESQVVPGVVALLFTFLTAGVLVGGLGVLGGQRLAWLGGLLIFGTSEWVRQGAGQYADVPLAFYLVSTLLLLCLAERAQPGRETYAMTGLAGVALGIAAWTKNEGLLFAVAVVGILGVRSVLKFGWKAGDRLIWLGLGSLAPLALLAHFKVLYAPTTDLVAGQGNASTLAKILDPSRYFLILNAYGAQLKTFGGGAILILAAFLVVVGLTRSQERRVLSRFVLAAVSAMLAGYSLVYLTTPYDLAWHLHTSLDRLVTQIWPCLILAGLLAARANGLPDHAGALPEGAASGSVAKAESASRQS